MINGTCVIDLFESSVILYGSQALHLSITATSKFESSVILYGSQACRASAVWLSSFESSVILYGSQAEDKSVYNEARLRVV